MKLTKSLILSSSCVIGFALSSGAALAGFIDADHRAESVSYAPQPESSKYQPVTSSGGFIDWDHSAASVSKDSAPDSSKYAYEPARNSAFIDWDHRPESVMN